jgi:hypothetical protein
LSCRLIAILFQKINFTKSCQEKTRQKWGPLAGTLVLGAFFGAWLLPEFLRPDSNQYAMGVRFYPWFILTEIGWSVMMACVYIRTKRSALVAGYLFHAAFNVWPLILLTHAVPGEPLPAIDTTLFVVHAVVTALAAAILLIVTRGRLGHTAECASGARDHISPSSKSRA